MDYMYHFFQRSKYSAIDIASSYYWTYFGILRTSGSMMDWMWITNAKMFKDIFVKYIEFV